MTDIDRQILELDLKHLTDKQTQWLHDLKSKAFKISLQRDFEAMKQQRMVA